MITEEQQEILRRDNQFSSLYLTLHQPEVVFSCRLSSVPSSNNKVVQLSYNTATGDYTDILPGMTLWIGTSAGSFDMGMARIRKEATSSILYIGEISDIKWNQPTAENFIQKLISVFTPSIVYLTVVDEFGIWAKHPRLLSNGTFYMDYDVAYSDQHENMKPVVNMGTHAVAWLDNNGEAVVQLEASNSFCLSSGTKTYLWSCTGGTIDDNDADSTFITFDNEGVYRLSCRVTVDGVSRTSYRYIFIYSDSVKPIENFIVENLSGDFERGGWELECVLNDSSQKVRANQLVILSSRDFYDGEEHSIGAEEGRENIMMVGWIDGETIDLNPVENTIQFTVKSSQHFLSELQSFTDGIGSVQGDPGSWTEMKNLNIDKANWHLLEWRSTALNCFDWYPTNDVRFIKESYNGEGSIWQQMFLNLDAIAAKACFDKYGKLYTEVEQQLVPPSSRSGFPVFPIEMEDLKEKITVTRINTTPYSFCELSGVFFQEGQQPRALFSLAPGNTFKRYGKAIQVERMALENDQSKVNNIAGMLLAWYNREFEFSIQLATANKIIDICPRQRISIELEQISEVSNIGFRGNVIPRSIEMREVSPETGFIYFDIIGENETFPENSTKGIPPTAPEDTDLSLPPMPPFPPAPPVTWIYPPPTIENTTHPKRVVTWAYPHGILGTEDFHNIGPTWYAMNNGLSSADYEAVGNMVVTPSGAIYAIVNGGVGALGWARVVRAASLGATWYTVFEASQEHADASISGIGVNPFASDHVAIVAGQNFVNFGTLDTSHVWIGTGGSFSQGDLIRHKYAYYIKGITFWNGGWHITGHRPTGIGGSGAQPRMWRYTPSGSLDLIDIDGAPWGAGAGATVGHMGVAPLGDKLLAWDGNTDGYSIINDVEAVSVTDITTDITLRSPWGVAMSPTGTHGMGYASAFGPPTYKTTDGAASWQTLTGTIPLGSNVYENCKDNNRFIFGGGSTIRLTLNQGAFYYDKMGNMPLIAPMTDIRIIRYIS